MAVFRFKRFAIDQTGCAMKINTDGVLLGAMATVPNPMRVLDIGTGTGVIALMLAQRFPSATIDAIEIDPIAADAARKNFIASSYAARTTAYAVALEDFEPTGSYDLIVSNPPFFLHSLKNTDARKQLARHTDMTFFTALLMRSARWLSHEGSLQLILPTLLAGQVRAKVSTECQLIMQGEKYIRSFGSAPVIRHLLAIGKMPHAGIWDKQDFIIYEDKGVYSGAYRKLLEDFFLAF
ncbi:tRNA1(Val) (adenine(37)-N6)-methyltransferase [Parapedobacter koreensis]|uniref:tRNA1(Val) (adenine(37)-N6)-methyltransferase n=1 Tax=Parapedobacter koreensis TaxID=332977 RepID=A0A1H7JI26_9SPHI|nr:methyltransferase [Parapedobacter koreensis]SEK73085.1 tRNA1Val (adenine37-N6)-methyltransferase [Parapedobacter koreensis]